MISDDEIYEIIVDVDENADGKIDYTSAFTIMQHSLDRLGRSHYDLRFATHPPQIPRIEILQGTGLTGFEERTGFFFCAAGDFF